MLSDYEIRAGFFVKEDGSAAALRRERGTIGLDVMVLKGNARVLAFDLKIGRGMNRRRAGDLIDRLGTDVIEIFLDRKK